MDMQWSTIWQYSNAAARNSKRDPFADPLDGPEWEGLIWAPVLAAAIIRRLAEIRPAFPIRDGSHRPVNTVPDHGVCVS